jgi:hypothetical protein
MTDYTQVLNRRYNAEWTLNGDDYSGLTWLSDSTKPSKKTLDDLWPEVSAEIEAEKAAKVTAKAELLTRLGITAEEAKILLS